MRARRLIAVALLLSAAPAMAADQGPVISCIAMSGVLASNPDPAAQQAGLLSSIFWLGRLDPSTSEAELETGMAALAAEVTQERGQAELRRCGVEMGERGAMLQRVGKKLKDRAAAAVKP